MLVSDFIDQDPNRLLGDTFEIGLQNLRLQDGGPMPDGLRATFALYDAYGGTVLAATPMAIEPYGSNGGKEASYLLRTGAGFPITAIGTYRAVYEAILPDLETRSWQQVITIQAAGTAASTLQTDSNQAILTE